MDQEASHITPAQALSALSELRHARDTLNHRAAGLSLMVWALVFSSATGSLLLLDKVPLNDPPVAGWLLYLAANVAAVAAWAAVGAGIQGAIHRSFNVKSRMGATWKAPAIAFGAAFVLVAFNLVLQGIVRSLQGLGVENATRTMEQIEHNLAFAFALGIAGALLIAITILLGFYGFRRAPGIALGAGMMLFGHSTAFLWFPTLGIAAVLLAVAAMPLSLLGLGYYFWRRG